MKSDGGKHASITTQQHIFRPSPTTLFAKKPLPVIPNLTMGRFITSGTRSVYYLGQRVPLDPPQPWVLNSSRVTRDQSDEEWAE